MLKMSILEKTLDSGDFIRKVVDELGEQRIAVLLDRREFGSMTH